MKLDTNKIKNLYKKIAIISFNTLLLFLLINIVFYFIPSPLQSKINFINGLHWAPAQLLKSDTLLLKKVYCGLSIQAIQQRINAPHIKSHPVLPFMNQPVNNECYRLGIENSRYDSYMNSDSMVRQSINQGIWVFGGSTVFGTGVCGDETISHYLNSLDSSNHYLNFGCQGYNQFAEIEKLILLLKKGYQPKSVLFVDGLNDLVTLSHYCFSAIETPARIQHAYEHELGPDQIKLNRTSIYALPVLNWYMAYKACKTINGSLPIEENIYDPQSAYNQSDYLHYLSRRLYIHSADEKLKTKMLTYYQSNWAFVKKLSEAYGFNVEFFFQPIGLLYPNHPFKTNQVAFDTSFLSVKQCAYLEKEMRQGIKAGTINYFTDLSQAHFEVDFPYIDLCHYSPKMNEVLAKKILQKLSN